MNLLRSLGRRALLPGLSVLSALILGGVVIVITDFENLSGIGTDPVGAIGGAVSGVFNGYGAMIVGAFGEPGRIITAFQTGNDRDIATAIRPLTETLVAAMPLIFVGLAVAVSFRAGMFNIGGNGQLMLGALGATIVAIALQTSGLPAFVILVLAIAASIVFGGFWGFIPGFLKARTGAHEVITTIMLNLIATQIVLFALLGPFLRQAGSSQPISKNMTWVDVPPIVDLPAIRLDWGFVVALATAGVISWLLFKTTKGFELRAAGFNPTAARYAGMSAGGSMMLAMSISGALAGMGGGFVVIGTVGQLSNDLHSNIGFNAIALALLAGLRPSGVVLAALLFGALTTGGKEMGIQTGIPFDLLFFIIALVIMFVAAPGLIRLIWRVPVTKAADVPSMGSATPADTV
ncbi:MAG TPA: ABC transporter permease [Candidatus Deferrimicrobiaceae bacterium]|nr:ABC transporter permease [Candidatus Deferrimicrobiaceae bacterium]